MTARRPRRAILSGAAALGVSALAGCLGGSEDPGSGGESTTTESHGDEDHSGETAGEGISETNHGGGDDHGHGANGHGANEGALDGPSPDATVAMLTDDGHHFGPHVVWVEAGGTVTWELESGAHSATAYATENDRPERIPEDGAPFDSGVLSEAGATFDHRFEAPGVYDYFCRPHESMGMVGTVVVGTPDPEGEPGLTPVQGDVPDAARTTLERQHERVRAALSGEDGEHGTGDHGTEHDESS